MKRCIEQILLMGGAAALIGCADNSVTDPRPRSSELQPSSVISGSRTFISCRRWFQTRQQPGHSIRCCRHRSKSA